MTYVPGRLSLGSNKAINWPSDLGGGAGEGATFDRSNMKMSRFVGSTSDQISELTKDIYIYKEYESRLGVPFKKDLMPLLLDFDR